MRHGGGGKSIHHIMHSANPQIDLGTLALGIPEFERRVIKLITTYVLGGDHAIGSPPLRQTEPQHLTRSDATHGRDMLVIGIQNGHAARHQALDDFGFRLRNALRRAEFPQMRHADLQHHGNVRRHQTRKIGNLAHVVGTHLRHEKTRARIDLQRSQRQTDLIVERTDRSHRLTHGRQQRCHQILSGGLAHGTGDADHGKRRTYRTTAFQIMLSQLTQRANRIVNHNLRHARIGHLMIDQRCNGPLCTDLRYEVVTIHALAGDGHEHRAFTDLTGIAACAGRHGPVRRDPLRCHQPSMDGLLDFGKAHRHHGRVAVHWFVSSYSFRFRSVVVSSGPLTRVARS